MSKIKKNSHLNKKLIKKKKYIYFSLFMKVPKRKRNYDSPLNEPAMTIIKIVITLIDVKILFKLEDSRTPILRRIVSKRTMAKAKKSG